MIHSMYLDRSRNLEFLDLMVQILGFMKKEDLIALKLDTEAVIFEEKIDDLSNALNRSYKSKESDELALLDERRGCILRTLKHVCDVFKTCPDKNKSIAANTLSYVMGKYGQRINELSYREETSAVDELLKDFQLEDNKNALELLFLNYWTPELTSINTSFLHLMEQRAENYNEDEVPTKEVREETQLQFERICNLINAYSYTEGEELYKNLASSINYVIAEAQELAKRRKTISDNDDENNDPE